MTFRRAMLVTLIVCLAGGCDDPGGGSGVPADTSSGSKSGTVTIGAEEGIDFNKGTKVSSANFQNSDIYATKAGGHLKLAPGGPTPIEYRPINWFLTPGNVHEEFATLADVPDEAPTDTSGTAHPNPETGNAFVVQHSEGGYTKGFLKEVTSLSVTIEFEPL